MIERLVQRTGYRYAFPKILPYFSLVGMKIKHPTIDFESGIMIINVIHSDKLPSFTDILDLLSFLAIYPFDFERVPTYFNIKETHVFVLKA